MVNIMNIAERMGYSDQLRLGNPRATQRGSVSGSFKKRPVELAGPMLAR